MTPRVAAAMIVVSAVLPAQRNSNLPRSMEANGGATSQSTSSTAAFASDLAHLRPRNLDFRIGAPGRLPPGWILNPAPAPSDHPALPTDEGYYGAVTRNGCKTGVACGMLISTPPLPQPLFTSLMQTVNAAPYHGKVVRLRASIRGGVNKALGSAQLWMRVDDPGEPAEPPAVWFQDARMQFCDARPPDWTDCEMISRVAENAASISFGLMLHRSGPAWIDRVSFDVLRELPQTSASPAGDSVAKLIAQVRQDIVRHRPDDQVAKALHSLKLTEHLEDRVIEELESEGPQSIGNRTAAELIDLRDRSAGLPLPADLPFPSPPAPSIGEQREIINRAAIYALGYASRLPDFMCTQTVRRQEDREGKGWKPLDILTIQVGYFDGTEHYRLAEVNHHPAKVSYDAVNGASSEGEFGSMIAEVFRLGAAKFKFDHWTTLEKRPAYAFSYSIPASNSNYVLRYGEMVSAQAVATAGQHGFVYLDRESAQVLRIARHADSIPADFPIVEASTTLDYDFFDVAGQRYLLPRKAEMQMTGGGVAGRNEIVFGEYRKFGGESKITFQ